MSDFAIDPVIQKLTHTLADWPLSRLFLYNDSRYQWGLLVPRRAGVIEMCDLSAADQEAFQQNTGSGLQPGGNGQTRNGPTANTGAAPAAAPQDAAQGGGPGRGGGRVWPILPSGGP